MVFQGVYVLQDENFKLLSKISKERDYEEEARKVQYVFYVKNYLKCNFERPKIKEDYDNDDCCDNDYDGVVG